MDGTLIEAWASLKSFRRKDEARASSPDDPGNPTVNFHGERRSNETHQSTTDPEALLARKGKGKEAKLCYSANALAENRNFLLVDFQVEPADGRAERRAAVAMADERLPASGASPLAGTRASILATSSRRAAHSRSLRTWPRITRGPGVPRSTRAPCAIPVMRSVNGSANGSRRGSAG